jgi:1-acyl-sn-glycerol-3-phosphate acyltransferase
VIVLDTFKDGAFRLAIEHQIPIVPITLAITKKVFRRFLSGSGIMRVKVHEQVDTFNKTRLDRRLIRKKYVI